MATSAITTDDFSIPNPARRCTHPGCITLLSFRNHDDKCYAHQRPTRRGQQLLEIPDDYAERELDGIDPEGPARECIVLGCSNHVAYYSKTGRCKAHYYITAGMRTKDGMVLRRALPIVYCSSPGCGAQLRPNNKTDLCAYHLKASVWAAAQAAANARAAKAESRIQRMISAWRDQPFATEAIQ